MYDDIVMTNGKIINIKADMLIPDNATNGDVIKALFPNCRYEHEKRRDWEWGHLNFNGNTCSFQVDDKWWNAPYKAGKRGGK